MKQIILPVAVVGLAIGGTQAFAQVNPSAPPAPQSMHQPAPAVDAAPSSQENGNSAERFEDHHEGKGRAARRRAYGIFSHPREYGGWRCDA